jgi:hypothetical protein
VQRADTFVGMAVAHEAVGRKASVTRALALHWSLLPCILCTAAAPRPSPHSGAGLQLEKVLLADVMEKSPDASYIELLRLFKVRRSVADGHSQHSLHLVYVASCLLRYLLPAHICSQLPPLIRT